MLITAKTLQGYRLKSINGEIGRVKEFYFDDLHWAIRYLVVDTGNWLSGRLVLISPYSLGAANLNEKHLKINLTKEQIQDSPPLDSDRPVSRQFEEHLNLNGTRIIKIFLHLSKDEQRKRFLSRIDEPEKNWKFSLADIHERTFWEQYMEAYEACMHATSTWYAPWYVVPADDKKNARLIVSQIILSTFNDLKMEYPKTSEKRRLELKSIRKQL